MYLKELTLRGFKSFASATTLRFEPGVTAVVGPNGSGKSNIVDALTWVMGEQGAKNLRGASMEDVIFAGTSSRPPLGRAQVSLTIDNTDHTLDIDYTEVTISRTIFRNGGSEYAINGASARLLDIQELLSDTGLGQQMHVIVGQGRLDAILRADPGGHRAFIEEAAGILKHRKRKERAIRQLANTQANLSRLDDLLGEIRRQLGPLGRQARISRKAEGIQVTLRDAQSRIYADDASVALARMDSARKDLTSVRGELAEMQRELGRVRLRIEQVEALSAQANPAIAQVNQTWHGLSQIEERLKSLASLARERARSTRGRVVGEFGEDSVILKRRAAELERQAQIQANTVAELRLALDKAVERRADDEKKLASVRQTITELRQSAQQRGAQIANLRELVAREESAVQLAESRTADFTAQQASLTRQRDETQAQIESLERENNDIGDDGEESLGNAKELLRQRQESLTALQRRRRDLDSTMISLSAKADALKDALESRNASQELEADREVDVLGRLADFIRIREGWEEAVAHALGAFAGAMVVPTAANMLHALQRAQSDQLGKAVVLHPIRDHAVNAAEDPSEGSSADGAEDTESSYADAADCDDGGGGAASGSAGALVSANPHCGDQERAVQVVRSVRSLLSGVAAVESRAEAVEALAGRRWRQAVTRAGESINRVGAVGGSSLSQSDLSLAARRDRALQQANELHGGIDLVAQETRLAERQRDEAQHAVDEATRIRTELRLKAQEAQRAIQSALDGQASLVRQIGGLNDRLAQTEEDGEAHRLKLDDLRRALGAAQESQAANADSEELAKRERDLESALSAASGAEVAAQIAWNEASHTAQSLARQAELLKTQASEVSQRRARIAALNERYSKQAAGMDRIAADALAVAGMVRESIADAVARREALQVAASGHDEELKHLRVQRGELEPKTDALQHSEHAIDVERERLSTTFGQLTQRVSDELGMSVDELVAEYGPDKPVPVLDEHGQPVPLEGGVGNNAGESTQEAGDDAAAADGRGDGDAQSSYQSVAYAREEQVKRLERARRDLAALGKVNPLATEEYDALQARNQYLNDQRNDVASSRDDLMKLITQLDTTMTDVFASAFDDTAKAFSQVFATLFPGGTGRLRLENPDDLLGTGVIVEASPAGKRVKQLSLLSGGERSLTALALLFAIFTARPSPFYVMDEVEAALDDANLTRLLDALDQLREHAQLIIITHQQRTMSIADALYGVTMRSDGVTAVVSQKLDREDDAH